MNSKKVWCLALLAIFAIKPAFSQETYKILPASTIQISGTSTLSDWVVKSGEVSGEMTFIRPGKTKSSDAGKVETIRNARAILEVSTIKSEKGETMDNKMYSALKSDSHPRIIFVLDQPIRPSPPGATFSAAGTIELAGVTKPMTFDLEMTYVGNNLRVQGKKSLKLSEFDIEPPTAMFGQIETGDGIAVVLDLTFGK